MAQEMRTVAAQPVVADPGPLGLAAFALTTFVLSAHNANLFGFGDHGNAIVIGLAIFYGGLAQFTAGMWAVRKRKNLPATPFSTYGGLLLAPRTYPTVPPFGENKAPDVLVSLRRFPLPPS